MTHISRIIPKSIKSKLTSCPKEIGYFLRNRDGSKVTVKSTLSAGRAIKNYFGDRKSSTCPKNSKAFFSLVFYIWDMPYHWSVHFLEIIFFSYLFSRKSVSTLPHITLHHVTLYHITLHHITLGGSPRNEGIRSTTSIRHNAGFSALLCPLRIWHLLLSPFCSKI